MIFRKAVESDATNIMNIIKGAQHYLKEQGIDQWQDNYPQISTIVNDINNGNSYVLIKDAVIVATTAIIFDGDKNYDNIYDGIWLSNDKYAAIHRIAVAANYKGLGLSSVIIKNVEEICKENGIFSIKVDTHKDNLSMQKLLQKNKFQYCGIIYLENKSKRVAFEKVLFNR